MKGQKSVNLRSVLPHGAGSAPVSGAGGSVPLSHSSQNEPIEFQQIRYAKRRLPHFERPWTIYAITIGTHNRRMLSPTARTIVLNALRHFHRDRYELFAACVMPDHVHSILQPWPKDGEPKRQVFWALSELLHSVKSFTAHQINEAEGRVGPLWEEEAFDRYIRSESDLHEKFRYVCANPWQKKIVAPGEQYQWLWTSEDEFQQHVRACAGPSHKYVGSVRSKKSVSAGRQTNARDGRAPRMERRTSNFVSHC